MGGGTGTGASPVIARIARELGILTVGVVTKPFQFEGQRRFAWQDAMAAELKAALAAITVSPGQSLAGTYTTTDPAQCDTENRLFTNPGASTFPKGITSICFERGIGEPPEPPTPISLSTGYLHYYRPVDVVRDGRWPVRDLCLLGTVAVVFWTIGLLIFRRKDIPVA